MRGEGPSKVYICVAMLCRIQPSTFRQSQSRRVFSRAAIPFVDDSAVEFETFPTTLAQRRRPKKYSHGVVERPPLLLVCSWSSSSIDRIPCSQKKNKEEDPVDAEEGGVGGFFRMASSGYHFVDLAKRRSKKKVFVCVCEIRLISDPWPFFARPTLPSVSFRNPTNNYSPFRTRPTTFNPSPSLPHHPPRPPHSPWTPSPPLATP
jgi:hypothetical protein